ncbi:uncharacterized protein B0H64DRAFT_432086 [Chaetomium fimeti]|uniref:Uncharacterized protein n=1 Tax=Chaetomium fimeti TaxID=1854472 RepID=A0AAE0HF16_9PEZI|nr:hypothetical protein B0H64DRAFT_432086 [Chaetomium fimeti]
MPPHLSAAQPGQCALLLSQHWPLNPASWEAKGEKMMTLKDFMAKSLAGHVSEGLIKKLEAEAGSQKDAGGERAIEVIDTILVSAELTLPDISALRLVKSLLEASGNGLDLCNWLLTETEKPASAENFFRHLIPRANIDKRFDAQGRVAAYRLRSRFFRAEPLAAMSVLIGEFSLSEPARTVAVRMLRVMGQEGLGAGESELVSRVREASFRETTTTPLPSDEELEAAADFIRSLASLCRVAEEPEDVPQLYNKKYRTVQSITREGVDDFTDVITETGMTKDRASSVHDKAERIDCWNDHLWLALMEARQRGGIPITPPEKVPDKTPKRNVGREHNNLTDIFLLQDETCETCCSVTGLSAYFADLMNLLSATRCKPDEKQTLLDVLGKRRPDLKYLELTCANSQTLIPYISLVNETLESFIRHKHKGLAVFNTPADTDMQDYSCGNDDDGDDKPIYLPGNTDTEIYSAVISQQMFPFPCFPYNQARDASAQILGSFKVGMAELVEVFRAPEKILQRVPSAQRSGETEARLTQGITEVLARQQAAEKLGMQQAEFVAITGETFFPPWVADLIRGLASDLRIDTACPWTTAKLWGYDNTTDMRDRESGQGLSFIKRQLMRRADLEFQDVVDLVNTRSFNQDLVITNRTGSEVFDSAIENLRLLCGSSTPSFTALTDEVCFRLQSFLRLRARLGWSTRNLDAAIHCLRTREMESAASGSGSALTTTTTGLTITPAVVKGLAAIVRLSSISGFDAMSLLPLWGTMDAYDTSSLLYRTFLTPALGQISRASQRPADGRVFLTNKSKTLLVSEKMALCTALRWPTERFNDLLKITGLDKPAVGKVVNLDVDAVSQLYRHVLLSRIFSVTPDDAPRFFRLFFDKGVETGWANPLENPVATLVAVEKWKKLLESQWTVKSLSSVVEYASGGSEKGIGNEDASAMASGLKLLSVISQGVRDIEKSLPFLSPDGHGIPSPENASDCAARTFDSETATIILGFVEGTQIQSTTVPLKDKDELQALVAASHSWTKKIVVSPSHGKDGTSGADIELSGLLSSAEHSWLDKLVTKPENVKDRLQELVKRSVRPRQLLASRFDCTDAEKQRAPEVKALFEDAQEDGSDIQAQLLLRERRRAFINVAGPTIIRDDLNSHIVGAVRELVPDVDEASIPVLLSNEVRNGSSEPMSAMAVLERLANGFSNSKVPATSTPEKEENLDVYMQFMAGASADTFTFSYDNGNKGAPSPLPELSLDGVVCESGEVTGSWKPLKLAPGRAHRLQANFPSSQLRWSTPKSLALTPLPLSDGGDTIQFLPATKVSLASRVAAAMKRMGGICKTLGLTPSDVEYVGSKPTATSRSTTPGFPPILSVDFNALAPNDLIRLKQYCELRDALKSRRQPSSSTSNVPDGFHELLEWLSKNPPSNASSPEAVAAKIADCTGWDFARVEALIEQKYLRHSGVEVVQELRSLDALLAMRAIIALDKRLEAAAGPRSRPSMAVLFGLAQPSLVLANTGLADAQLARDLQARLTPSQRATADEGLMENQRRALVQYLLQDKYVSGELGIWDADGLFVHFLIDVQMGPQLRTSRIKLAISVVQLFVQRCLLGLEKGVGKGSLVRADWEWRQQHSLWEVHRKLFLYPENWVEPTLRDTKSELFEQFEASLMQKNLSVETFTRAIKTYVYGLNDIARLEVVAYLRDGAGSDDTYHIFARTRAAPYSFYHRSLLVAQPTQNGGAVFWRPWTKIDMDIPSPETDLGGTRLDQTGAHMIPIVAGSRLYLFLPHMAPKTLPDTDGVIALSGGTFHDIAGKHVKDSKPKHIWEVSMAWTELTDDGKWTPKRVSPGCLSLNVTATPSQFQFDPFQEGKGGDTRVNLLVSYSNKPLGAFVFREDQISVLDAGAVEKKKWKPLGRPFTPSFQTVVSKGTVSEEGVNGAVSDVSGQKSLVWLPKGLKDAASAAQSIRWTLSHSGESADALRLLGLAVSSEQSDGTQASYFNVPRSRLVPTADWSKEKLGKSMDLARLDNALSSSLVQAAADRLDPLKSLYSYLGGPLPAALPGIFGKLSDDPPKYHELAQPTALYDWELGLHAVLLAVDRFIATQQFDEALLAARLVFDPAIDMVPGQSCWRFPPFRQYAEKIAKDGKEGDVDLQDLSKEIHRAILERRSAGALVHTTARGRPQAYMKWVVMRYAEALIASGDVHFRRGTMESLPLATQRYVEASHVLGPEPPRVPSRLAKKKTKVLCFDTLKKEAIKNELGLPFSAELVTGSGGGGGHRAKGSYIMSPYFCVPLNPKFKELRRLVNRRLHDLRNSLSIDGKPVQYALVDPPIDPAALIALGAQGGSVAGAMSLAAGGQHGPLPRQRFDLLLRRALELCSELRALGERLVLAIERKESEAFAALQARHTTAISTMTLAMRRIQLDEARLAIDSLTLRRESHKSQLAFYLALIGEPATLIPSPTTPWTDIRQDIAEPTKDDLRLSPYESLEMRRADAASVLNMVAAGMDQLVVPLCLIPNFDTKIQPMGVGMSMALGGSNFSSSLQASSAVVRNTATGLLEEGSRASRKSSLTSQLQERRRQANSLGREIKMTDKEIEIQKTRIRAAQQDMDMQQTMLDHATQTEAWLRTKYTNEQLYGWMEKSLRALHASAYEVAAAAAQRAEAALAFEQGRDLNLLHRGGGGQGSWQGTGLLAADHLYQDLKRLETTSLETPPHDFEITKAVSLRQVNPKALLRLRLTGTTTFSLPELLYDTDFPGHYMRRIRSVAVSIPAILGPHTGVNATLTLLSHKYRTSASAATGAEYSGADRSAFRTDNVPVAAVAVSSGSHDAGVFELGFGTGARYAPFEGAGAVSTWRLELPPLGMARFDYETISDVVLHVQYTASDGGACLRAAAAEAVHAAACAVQAEGRADGFWALWDLRNDFPGPWHAFASRLRPLKGVGLGVGVGEGGDEVAVAGLRLGNLKDRLPFWSRRQKALQVCTVSLLSRSAMLVQGVEVFGADGIALSSEVGQDEELGDCTLRTWAGLDVQNLDGWEVRPKQGQQLLGEKETVVENVYMMIRYVFKGE